MSSSVYTKNPTSLNQAQPDIPDLWYFLFAMMLVVFSSFKANAQGISFSYFVPTDLTVCGTEKEFEIEMTNTTGSTLSNLNITIDLPIGIIYTPNSVNEVSNFNIQEGNIIDPYSITLSANDLPSNQILHFTIQASAEFEAYTSQLEGNTFLNTISVSYDGGSTTEESDAYNILYPALSITNISPMSASVFVGQTYTRTITVVNGGYGSLSTFDLTEIDDSNLQLNSTDIGTFDPLTQTVTFSPNDFTAFGNGDDSFDQNESITFTQSLTAIGCNSTQSALTAYWGCNEQTSNSNTKYPYTTIQLFAPALNITPQASINTCMDGSPNNQQLIISNNGTGPANNLEIVVTPKEQHSVTEIDQSSISYSLNESSVSINPTNTTPAYLHTCFTENAIDGFTVQLPTIPPGETLILDWDNYTCASQSCGKVHYVGWNFEAAYTDMCDSKIYESEGEGQREYEKGFSTFFESPSDLVDQEEGTYSFIISSATFKLPEGNDPYFEVVFDIPEGLIWKGGSNDLTFNNNVTIWAVDQIDYNTNTRKLTAKYHMPLANGFHLNHSTFDLKLTADCTSEKNWVTVGMQLFYILDKDCQNPYRIPMTCYENPQTQLHCPGSCERGMSFQNFSVARVSFGNADNDLNGLPDDDNNLDFTKIKTNRVMMNDTFQTVFTGLVKTSTSHPSWSYGYAKSFLPYGNSIEIKSAIVSILDASTGLTYVCDQVPFTQSIAGDIRQVNFDYSPATLVENGCTEFENFVLEQDDQVILTATYQLIENIGGSAEQVMIQNDFYLSDQANGTAFQCNDWNGNFTVVGFFHRVNRAEQYDVKTCTKIISQSYKMSVGDCCTNYAGGNMFPYEYRNWSYLKDLRVEIPFGYSFVSAYVDQWRTVTTNITKKETATIQPINPGNTNLVFDMEQYLVKNGGTLNLSDDGYNGKIYIELQPTCTVNQAANNPINWFFNFQKNDFIGGQLTDEFTYAPDYIQYYRAKLDVSTTLATQEGIAPTVQWDIKIKSKKANASKAWFYLQNQENSINILEVKDLSDNSIINPINGFYQIESFDQNEIKNYQITAGYNSCNTSELKVITGHDCNGYPQELDAYQCESEELKLFIAPQPSELQVKFNNFINPLDECDHLIGIELELLSSKLAAVQDLAININIPNTQTITIESGSLEVLYPTSGNYTSLVDPILSNNTYSITGMDIDQAIGVDGLVGVTDLSRNIVKLKFNILLGNDFQPGDLLDIEIAGMRPCGNHLPTLALLFDPNASFGNLTGIGLDESSNNWAAAWGDYDNDGHVDLFVTNYETTEPNLLYHNNGDGTFTKTTNGAITSDLASSLAATWGDYDNDGDLDLYVANNIGYANFLYRNNGNGSFTKVTNDPIVNDKGYAHGVSWIDYDNDGFLDMFVADYFSTKFNQLFHNNGDGTFTKATNAAPVLEANFSVSGAWGDYNNDGYVDLFVANTNNQNNSLYKNQGDGRFLKINIGAIVNDGGNSVGGSWGDYDNDGDLDLFVSNSGNQNNFLYQNNGDETFTKVTDGPIPNDQGHSHGSAWADYDNDGDLDLFVSNDQGQDNFLYSNKGNGVFTKTINQITQDNGDSFGAAWADFDNDGDLDLFIANHNATQNFIYKNSRGKCQNKSCIVLNGTSSNRSAIGSKVFLKANIYGQSVWQMREISAQTGGGIGGQNELKTIFGLGNATAIDSIIVKWSSGYQQVITNPNINDCLTIEEENASEICGIVYLDTNENCIQDENEKGISNLKLIIQPGNRTVMTDENGEYSIQVETGNYTIQEEANGTNWTPTCILQKQVNVNEIGNTYCGNNFANQALCALPDLKVELSTTAHRVGFENLLALTYKNEGGQEGTNVALTIAFGQDVIPLESSIPWDLSVGTDRRWNLGEVAIGESVTIYIKDSVSTNAVIGEDISIKATIYGLEEDCLGEDNVFINTQTAVGAIDPNDISVNPEGYIDAGTELVYKVRFQNVGNSMVSTVRIEDELPEGLDLNTFQQGVTSHPYRLHIEGNKVIWTFENINMPDSLSNEAESHGFLIFKIKTKKDLENNTTLANNVAIYFDNSAPMHTNTVVNIIGQSRSQINAEGQLYIFPNPMTNQSKIEIALFENESINIQSIFIYDLLGNKLQQQIGIDSRQFVFNKNQFVCGCYFLKVIGANGQEYSGRLFIQ